MCQSAPESAWNVIQEIIALDQSDEILANVGVGPHLGSGKADGTHRLHRS